MFELELAKRFLFSSRQKNIRSVRLKTAFFGIFLACFGLFLGAMIIAGYHQTFQKAILDFNAHIIVKKYTEALLAEDQQHVSELLQNYQKTFPHVSSGFDFAEALVVTDEGMQAVVFKGIDFHVRKELYPFDYEEKSSFENQNGVYMGRNLFRQGLRLVGKSMSFLVQDGEQIKRKLFPLQGSFQTGVEPYDSEFVLIDLQQLAKSFRKNQPPSLLGYEIKLQNFADIPKLTLQLKQDLGADFEVIAWDDLNFSLIEGLRLEKTTFMTVGFCVLLIASLNIFGFNLMFFLQNREQFQILATLGYSKKRMRRLFTLLSVFVALLASGLALLLTGAIALYLIKGPGLVLDWQGMPEIRVRAVWEWFWVMGFLLGTVVLCYFTSTLAARVILKTDIKS